VKTGIPTWAYVSGGIALVVVVLAAIVYPIYHRAAVVKTILGTDAALRSWAKDEAVRLGSDKMLDPLIETAKAQCPPEAAADLMSAVLKLTADSTSEYVTTKVRRFAELWVNDAASEKRLAAARGLSSYFGYQAAGAKDIAMGIADANKSSLLALVKDTEQSVRKEVVSGLVVPCYTSTEIALVGVSDADLQVRRKAAEMLMAVATPDACQMLLSKALSTTDVGLKATIVRALAVRENAARVGSGGFAPLLKDPSSDVRREVIVALAHAGDPGVTDMLTKALDDPSAEVRHEVIMNALYRRDQKLGLAAADRLLIEPATEVKIRVLKAVGPLSLTAAKDKIVALALKKDEVTEVRVAALNAIGALNLSKPAEKYGMIDALLPAIDDTSKEVSDAAMGTANELMTGRAPKDPAGWHKWMDEKRPIIGLLEQIDDLVKQGNAAYEANNQTDGENAYFKAGELYDEIMKVCPDGEKSMYEKVQQNLNIDRMRRQRSRVIDVRNEK
jgi:HEAT repeat protein